MKDNNFPIVGYKKQCACNSLPARQSHFPKIVLQVADRRHTDLQRSTFLQQAANPKETRFHIGRQRVEFAVDPLIKGLDGPSHLISQFCYIGKAAPAP